MPLRKKKNFLSYGYDEAYDTLSFALGQEVLNLTS